MTQCDESEGPIVRVVIDTNVVVSGLLWHGPPRQILRLARTGALRLFSSPAMFDELERVLARPHLSNRVAATGLSSIQLVTGYQALTRTVYPTRVLTVISDDPEDDIIIACAVETKADRIVSGDHHLLNLRSYHGIEIVSAAEMLRHLDAR